MFTRSGIVIGLLLLGVVTGTGLLYWEGLSGPFLLDDRSNIQAYYVGDFDLSEMLYAVSHNYSGIFGRPVSALSFALSGIMHGPSPWGYKFHNLAIHLVNGLLIFWLLLKILPKLSVSSTEREVLLIAGCTASLWLVHPLMVSTVLYAVQRMAQLSSLFSLCALLIYVSVRDNAAGGRTRFYLLAYLCFPLCMALAILSKENGVLIPLYIFAIELIVYQFSYSEAVEKRRIFFFMGVFIVLPVVLGLVYILTHFGQIADYSLRTFDLGDRLLTQLHVVVFYLKLILLPRLSDMSLYHDGFEITRNLDLLTTGLLLLLISAVVAVFYLRRKAPVISFAIAWFLISHLLESTFIGLEMVFEHRNYLAALGPMLMLVYYLLSIRQYRSLQFVAGLFLTMMVFMTGARVKEWSSEQLFHETALIDHPDSYRVQSKIANMRYLDGDLASALVHIRKTQELKSNDFGPVLHEVVYLCNTGEDLDPLVGNARIIASRHPVTPYSLNSLDNIIKAKSEEACPEVDLEKLVEVVVAAEQLPSNRMNQRYLGFLEKIEGHIRLLMGEYQQGAGLLLSAFEKTERVSILANLADILIDFDRLDEAALVIDYMARINTESFGIEDVKLQPLLDRLDSARQKNTTNAE